MSIQNKTIDDSDVEVMSMKEMNLSIGLLRAEVDQQIATAHAYPRSIKVATDAILELATLDEETAEECMYSVPRAGKTIEGPSIRLAEIIISQWGNCRCAVRIVREENDFIVAQAVFHDLQTNVAISADVQRSVLGRNGKRYSNDMVQNTQNAAMSIARRNIILAGVPKAVWRKPYEAARKVVMGDLKTLANRRADGLKNFQRYGVVPEQVFTVLGVAGEEDISLDHLVTMRGMLAALKNNEATVESMFPRAEKEVDKNYNPLVKEKTDLTTGEVTQVSTATGGKDEVAQDQGKTPTEASNLANGLESAEAGQHTGTTDESSVTKSAAAGAAHLSGHAAGHQPAAGSDSAATTIANAASATPAPADAGTSEAGGGSSPQPDLLSGTGTGGNGRPDGSQAEGADGSRGETPSAPDRLRNYSKALLTISSGGPPKLVKQSAAWLEKWGAFEGDEEKKRLKIYDVHLARMIGDGDIEKCKAAVEGVIGK